MDFGVRGLEVDNGYWDLRRWNLNLRPVRRIKLQVDPILWNLKPVRQIKLQVDLTPGEVPPTWNLTQKSPSPISDLTYTYTAVDLNYSRQGQRNSSCSYLYLLFHLPGGHPARWQIVDFWNECRCRLDSRVCSCLLPPGMSGSKFSLSLWFFGPVDLWYFKQKWKWKCQLKDQRLQSNQLRSGARGIHNLHYPAMDWLLDCWGKNRGIGGPDFFPNNTKTGESLQCLRKEVIWRGPGWSSEYLKPFKYQPLDRKK